MECRFGVFLPALAYINNISISLPVQTHERGLNIITHAPLFRGGADDVYESSLGDSRVVMNIHNPFMHCATSQCVFKPRDVIMLMHAVKIIAA